MSVLAAALLLAGCGNLPGPTQAPEVLVVTATSGPATEVPPTAVIAEVTQEATSEPAQEATAEPTVPPPTAEPATAEPTQAPAAASGELGMAGNPVTTNLEWTPVAERMGGLGWVLVPAGCFSMGWRDGFTEETPEHEVCFDNPFWITRTEITNEQFGSNGPWAGEDAPRTNVSWTDAGAFCQSKGGRLPTEAEWEYAAKGPSNLRYPMGDTLQPGFVIHAGNATSVLPVGNQPQGASWVGAYDMLGNAAEWTSSAWEDYPYDAEDGRERGPEAGETRRVVRGSSYQSGASRLRNSLREFYQYNAPAVYIGFRCAADYTAP